MILVWKKIGRIHYITYKHRSFTLHNGQYKPYNRITSLYLCLIDSRIVIFLADNNRL